MSKANKHHSDLAYKLKSETEKKFLERIKAIKAYLDYMMSYYQRAAIAIGPHEGESSHPVCNTAKDAYEMTNWPQLATDVDNRTAVAMRCLEVLKAQCVSVDVINENLSLWLTDLQTEIIKNSAERQERSDIAEMEDGV